jgi:hypothetical protein
MTPSQLSVAVEAFAALKKAGANPAHLELHIIPEEPQKLLTYSPSKAYKPAHGGYPGVAK